MKNNRKYLAYLIVVLAGLSLFAIQCKEDTKTITGQSITGLVTYPDYSGTAATAKGAVIYLYSGSSASGNLVTSTFADASGKYTFANILAGSYFIAAKYNNENQNYKAIDGINFVTNPGYAINMGEAALTQDISLVSSAATSTLKISLDTVANPGYRPIAWEIHSKLDWSFTDHASGAELPGGFNVFEVDQFVFDAANPANSKISGFVLLSTINTLEPERDALLTGGCVPKTLLVAVDSINQIAVPETDTARFIATSVVKYGDGYLAHGTMEAFYHHGPGQAYPADTNYTVYTGGFAPPAGTPKASVPSTWWNKRVTKPCDLYFVYQGKFPYSKNADGSTKNLCFKFEGELVIHPQADYYISSAHFSDGDIKVNTHVQFLGALNDTNYPE